MKISNIRIGNYFYLTCEGHEHEPDLICWGVEDFDFYEDRMNDIEPIKLTKDFLKKLGFKIANMDQVFFALQQTFLNYFCLNIEYTEDRNIYFSYYPNTLDKIDIFYIHQLQNLFYAITGKELSL